MRSKPSKHFFSIIDLAKWAQKLELLRGIGRTNEVAGLIPLTPNSARSHAPHELVARG